MGARAEPTLPRPLQALAAGFYPQREDWGSHTLPADFLIGPDGRIQIAHYGRDIADHLPLPRLYQALGTPSSNPPPSVP
ncbi:hypothetical protein [Marinithermus hydrothermalis]|uniref:hypothetical protein n=1 Tax=Marinithermus hydrothermalis TaxID=186192 RepID=UPI0002D5D0D9|nr:hypothetical protein [Marinithermus hydrothermalis]